MAELHDLAGFYVLDALDPTEKDEFESHLEGCQSCRTEIGALSGGVEALARSVAEPAPAEMKRAVMSTVTASTATVLPFRKRSWQLVAVAAVAALVFGIGTLRVTEQERFDQLVAAADSRQVSLQQSGVGPVEIIWSAMEGAAAFRAETVPEVDDDQTYQLWLIGPGGPVSAGTFRPGSDGAVLVILEGTPSPGLVVGLTVEPEGGSNAPTGEVLAALEI